MMRGEVRCACVDCGASRDRKAQRRSELREPSRRVELFTELGVLVLIIGIGVVLACMANYEEAVNFGQLYWPGQSHSSSR